jgi:hypothetical protein
MNKPKFRLVMYSISLVVMLLILLFTLIKHNFVISWGADYIGTILMCAAACISNPIQIISAYKELKKAA